MAEKCAGVSSQGHAGGGLAGGATKADTSVKYPRRDSKRMGKGERKIGDTQVCGGHHGNNCLERYL